MFAVLKSNLRALRDDTAQGLLVGIGEAVAVARLNDEKKNGAWLNQSAREHAEHADAHLSRVFGSVVAGEEFDSSRLDDDGTTHSAHAACRLLMMECQRVKGVLR